MRLLKLNIKSGDQSGGILDDFSIRFHRQEKSRKKIDPICFVGVNGSGKSQLLQVIAEIFYYLDDHYRNFNPTKKSTNLIFEIEYLINHDGENKHIKIVKSSKRNEAEVYEIAEDEKIPITDSRRIEKLLPSKVIRYTSGENKTLSIPFLDTYQQYAKNVTELALNKDVDYDKVPDTRLVHMDYNSNIAILVANFLFRDPKELSIFSEAIKIKSLNSFRIILQLRHTAGPTGGVKLTEELKTYIKQFKKCSTCYHFNDSTETWTFDFYVNEATQKAFRYHFKSAFNIYSAFYKLELLNRLIIKKQHITAIHKLRKDQGMVVPLPIVPEADKAFRFQAVRLNIINSPDPVDYIALSDGEHQFTHIYGTVMMVKHENVLFLLDVIDYNSS